MTNAHKLAPTTDLIETFMRYLIFVYICYTLYVSPYKIKLTIKQINKTIFIGQKVEHWPINIFMWVNKIIQRL